MQLPDKVIGALPLHHVQQDGLLFVWTINVKYPVVLNMMKEWGYRYVGEVVWVKTTKRGNICQGNGFYLQHAKETCLVAMKVGLMVIINDMIEM